MSDSKLKLVSQKKFESWHIPEPWLIFGDGKTHIDPKMGLAYYGPLKTPDAKNASPMSIRIGVIGTGETIGLTSRFISRLSGKIEGDMHNPFLSPDFPGFTSIFDCVLMTSESFNATITNRMLHDATAPATFEERVERAANLFLGKIENISQRIPKPEVIICALPQKIVDFCVVRKSSTGAIKTKKTKEEKELIITLKEHRKHQQAFLDNFGTTAEQLLADEVVTSNLWKQIKANSMKFGIPTQIVLPSTLLPKSELGKSIHRQNDSTTAWNFSVALYYKGSGFPWTMTKMKKDTCYIGISFFKNDSADNTMRTSLAQIFTYTGEGLVLQGKEFEWDTNKSPHLNEAAAKELLKKAIDMYSRQMDQIPTRVVVHKSSRYWPDEKKGFEKALEGITYHDLITIGNRDIRFLRCGQYPPLRGTVIKIGRGNYVMYANGYVPYLKTYPGPHIPSPLEILEHHGDSSHDVILAEILALSKMNWNSADFVSVQPITLLFSQRVGSVMASLPRNVDPKREYRYYM